MRFGIAETQNDRIEAGKLIQNVFVDEMGFSRIGPDRFDDDAIFVTVRSDSDLIATIRIILDGPSGLPLDKYVNIDNIRRQSGRLAEVSRLACHSNHRNKLVTLKGAGFLKSMGRKMGATHFVCDALIELVPLYARVGFVAFGEPFIDISACKSGENIDKPNAQVMWAAVRSLKTWHRRFQQ